jgi:hypothetical protein
MEITGKKLLERRGYGRRCCDAMARREPRW